MGSATIFWMYNLLDFSKIIVAGCNLDCWGLFSSFVKGILTDFGLVQKSLLGICAAAAERSLTVRSALSPAHAAACGSVHADQTRYISASR